MKNNWTIKKKTDKIDRLQMFNEQNEKKKLKAFIKCVHLTLSLLDFTL